MSEPVSRRTALKTIALTGMAALPGTVVRGGAFVRVVGAVRGAVALGLGTAVGAAVRRIARRQAPQAVRREQVARAGVDDAALALGRQRALWQRDGEDLIGAQREIVEAVLEQVLDQRFEQLDLAPWVRSSPHGASLRFGAARNQRHGRWRRRRVRGIVLPRLL